MLSVIAYFASKTFFSNILLSILQCLIVTSTYPQGKQQWKHYLWIYSVLEKRDNSPFSYKNNETKLKTSHANEWWQYLEKQIN